MGYRFRRSVKLGPGVRMTVSKSGVGFSFGGRGLRYTIGSTGRRTLTTGIPGSGLSRSRTVDKRNAPLQRVAAPPKPGLLASHTEKAFHRGVRAMASVDESEALRLFLDAAAADTKDRSVADDLLAGLLLIQTGRGEEAEPFLVKVIESDRGLPDQLMSRYLPAASVDLEIAEGCRVSVPLGSVAAVMALAEIYQDTDRVEDATGLIEQLHETSPEPAITLSLCDLYAQVGAWHEIVEITNGTSNDDDLTAMTLVYRGRALLAAALPDGAIEAFRAALRSSKRSPDVLKAGRYGRALSYEAQGKARQARTEFEKLYAMDADYADVAQRLQQ